jgi:hypothetical protein
MIAVPFGIEDQFPETFVTALYNSWESAGDEASDLNDDLVDTSFSDELQKLFDEDATERCCHECEEWFEPKEDWDDDCCPRCREDDEDEGCDCGDCERCLADDTCVARCGDRGTIKVMDQNCKDCLVCKDCCDWFKNKVKGYEAEQKAFEAEAEEAEEAETCVKCNNAFTFEDNLFKGFNRETGGDRMCQNCFAEEFCEEHEQPKWKDGLMCSGCLNEEAEKKVNLTVGA